MSMLTASEEIRHQPHCFLQFRERYMEAKVSQSLQLSARISSEKIARKSSNYLQFLRRIGDRKSYLDPASVNLLAREGRIQGPIVLKVLFSTGNVPGDYE